MVSKNETAGFLLPAVLLAVVCYATAGTSLATDDFVHLNNGLIGNWARDWLPKAYLSVPILHYALAAVYYGIGNHMAWYGVVKAVYLCFAMWGAARLFGIFHSPKVAWIGAAVFCLNPVHDGASLWLTGQYLILSAGCYFHAYASAHQGKLTQAAAMAGLGSFSSYGSSPLAAGLALMFMMQRRWREAAAMALPNAVYVAYYLVTSLVLKAGTQRIPGSFDPLGLAKSYALQVASFIDAGLGPSAWLKLALALPALSWVSLLVAAIASWLMWRRLPATNRPHDRPLLAGAIVITLTAFGVFALTGSYPQIAFNLGDRITIYGNILVAVVLMHVLPTRALAAVATVVLAAFIGMGDHWKAWGNDVAASVVRIKADTRLAGVPPRETLFVRGMQYSQLGPISHIDHLTSGYVIREVFALARPDQTPISTASFNRRLRFEGNSLVDVKYGDRWPVTASILLYDAQTGELIRIPAAQISGLLDALPIELRHWTQLLGPGMLRDAILWLIPNVRYAYA